jgi:hypothetical protein
MIHCLFQRKYLCKMTFTGKWGKGRNNESDIENNSHINRPFISSAILQTEKEFIKKRKQAEILCSWAYLFIFYHFSCYLDHSVQSLSI